MSGEKQIFVPLLLSIDDVALVHTALRETKVAPDLKKQMNRVDKHICDALKALGQVLNEGTKPDDNGKS